MKFVQIGDREKASEMFSYWVAIKIRIYQSAEEIVPFRVKVNKYGSRMSQDKELKRHYMIFPGKYKYQQ